MTCPSLARRAMAPAELAARVHAASTFAASGLRRLLVSDAATAQLTRFAATGALATSVQVLVFTLLASTGALTANVVSWGISTALANELHRRRTFRAGDRVGVLAGQLEGGGSALLALLATSAALALFSAAAPGAGAGAQVVLVLGVTAAVGLLRFVVLRWSFVVRRPRTA